jgi:hypothetical protein
VAGDRNPPRIAACTCRISSPGSMPSSSARWRRPSW